MIRYFASHPTAANLLMILLIVMGLLSVRSLRRETFPEFVGVEVEVRVPYPGATAEEVEQAVCRRIEDAVDGVSYIEEARSEAREGMGVVTIEMVEGADAMKFLDDIKTEIDAIDDLPDEAELPIVRRLATTDPVVSVAVVGPMSAADLKTYCERLKERMQRLEDISLVEIEGFSERQLRIEIPAIALMQLGLSVADVAEAVERQSVDLPAGTIRTRERDVLVRFTDERRTPRELESLIVVSGETGAEIRLGDIATVTDRFELDEEKILYNGRRAGLLGVMKNKSEDGLRAFDAVVGFVERERKVAPPGVEFHLTRDVSSIARDRLNLLVENGWKGLILVFLAMWAFFSLRYSFWVAMGLPASFLGAIFFMPLFDYSLNMLTMVALLLALGLMMDDSIVISENIAAQLKGGKPPLQAAVDGVKLVGRGVISSFLTTVCIFLPISNLDGRIGRVLQVMPIVLILVLSVSLIEAFLILPNHLAHSLAKRAEKPPGRLRRRFERTLDVVRDRGLGAAVDWAVRRRYFTVGLTAAAFLISAGMVLGGALKFQAFPDLDGDAIEARVLLPQGTPLRRTEEIVAQIEAAFARVNDEFRPRQPGGADLVKGVSARFSFNIDAYESGAHVATVTADLLGAETRDAPLDEVLPRLRQIVGRPADVISLKFAEPAIGPAGRPIDIRLLGEDLDRLGAASLRLRGWLGTFRGVEDLSDDLRPGKPEMRVKLREGAGALGLSAGQIASQLRAAYQGRVAGEIQVGAESYEIDVRLAEADRDALADLAYFHVTAPGGAQVPLDSVARVEPGRSWARIARIDGRRAVSVQGDVDTRLANTGQVIRWTEREFFPVLREEFPDVEASIEGEAKEGATTGASMRRAFAIGLIGVFLLLSFQFKSYVEPLIVMVAIPFAFVGVVAGHWVMGLPLSLPSLMGFVSLSGVVVNDSILLVEFVKIHRRRGAAIVEAAARASRERFRAVLLTSLTTIFGLLPLLAERSLQAQILVPLAASIVFGLMASTVLVLIVIPALYAALGDFGLAARVEVEEAERAAS